MSDLWIMGMDEDEAPRGRRGGRRRRRRSPLGVVVAIVVVIGLAGGVLFVGRTIWDRVSTVPDYEGQGEGSVTVEVKDGDTLADIAATLVEADVVKSEEAFSNAAEGDSRARTIQPGFYTLRKKMSATAALSLLLSPESRSGRVTLAEGQSMGATFAVLSEKSGIPVAEFEAAAANPAALGLPAYAEGRLEGFLYPATYDFPENATAEQMLKQMVATFSSTIDQATLQSGAQALGRTPYEVITIASLLEEEGITDDFSKIAQVLYNRLEIDMPLQLDSTVNYALNRNDIDVSLEDLQVESPYNTYQNEGLTPTPISNPGLQAVQAALNPEAGEWLYFVKATEDGHSAFAVTRAEHDANVAKAKAEGIF